MTIRSAWLSIALNAEDTGEKIVVVVDYLVTYEDTEGDLLDAMKVVADNWALLIDTTLKGLTINDVVFTTIIVNDLATPDRFQVVRNVGIAGTLVAERLPKGNCLYIAKKSSSRDRYKNGGFYMFPTDIDSNAVNGLPSTSYVNAWMAFWEAFRFTEQPSGLIRTTQMVITSRKFNVYTPVETFVPTINKWAFLKSRSGRKKKTTPPTP